MATVLGTGANSGSDTLTVSLTAAQPAGSFVHFIHAAVLKNLTLFDSPTPSSNPTDSKSGLWDDASEAAGAPILGAISDLNSAGPGDRAGLQLGQTAIRTPLSAPDLAIGDTVSVTWDDGGFGAAHMATIGAVVAFTEYQKGVPQFLGGTTSDDFVGIYYSNGNSNSLMPSFDGMTLTWNGAGLFLPYPRDTATMLTAAATYPPANPNSYVSAAGSRLIQVNSDDLSLAVTTAPAAALTVIEPGGFFAGSSVQIMVANYQFAVGATSIGLQSWQRF